jgi:hypothetical protein
VQGTARGAFGSLLVALGRGEKNKKSRCTTLEPWIKFDGGFGEKAIIVEVRYFVVDGACTGKRRRLQIAKVT